MTAARQGRQPPPSAEREASLLREIAALSAALEATRTGGFDAVMSRHEAELTTIAAGSADILAHTSADCRIEYVSPAVSRILGWESEEILGLKASSFVHPDDLSVTATEPRRGSWIPQRARLRCKDGTHRWMDTSVAPVGDPGSPSGFVAVVRDIDYLVLAEQALVESERHYRALVEGAAEALYESGPDRRVVWVSSAITPMLGWTPDDLVGTEMADLLDPEDHARTTEERAGVFAGHTPTQRSHTVRIRTKDGEYRWVSIWGKPVIDASGSLVRAVGGIQDVHDLVTARARLRATLDTEFDPHVVLQAVRDEAGEIVDFVYADANLAACEYNGIAYDDLVGSRLLGLMPSHLHSATMEMYRAVVETGEPLKVDDFVFANELRGGAVRRYDVQAAKFEDGLSYTWRDVTERFVTAEALAASEQIHRLLMENLSDVVVHIREGVVAWVTPSLTATLGWEPEDWLGQEIQAFVGPDELRDVDRRAAINRGDLNLFRGHMRAKDGRFHWILVHAKPYLDGSGHQDGIVASFRIIDTEVAAEAELEARARSDELTGLMNRREVLERVSVLTSHPRRTGEEAAVLFGDIDGFKAINDKYGHAAGDTVLHTVAVRINACLRSGDIAARIGGDELLILLDGVHELANAVDIADNIRRAVAQPIRIGDQTVFSATLSIGVTLAVPGEDVDTMIARADGAMYEAKRAGGDRVVAKLPPSA